MISPLTEMCQQTPISQEVGYKCFVAVDFTGVVINFKRKNDERKIKNEKKKETDKQTVK